MSSNTVVNQLSKQFVTNDSLHQLFESVNSISVQGYDEQRRVVYWNKGSELLYGFKSEEAFGNKLEDLIVPAPMKDMVVEAHTKWINEGVAIPAAEILLKHKNGTDIYVYSSHVMFENEFKVKQMYCIDIDLSDVKKAQAIATFKEQMLKTIFEAIPDLLFLMDHDGIIIDYHTNNKNTLYVSPEKFIGNSMLDILPKGVAKKFEIHIAKAIEQEEMVTFKYELTVRQGLAYFEARINKVSKYDQIMIIIRDITEQHQSEQLIRKQAYFDSLTQLPNRLLALDRLSQVTVEADRNDEKAAIFFLDLDDFKKINDSLGHEAGDKVLIETANRLQSALRKADTIGRLGGDEFIILSKGISTQQNAVGIAEKILQNFRDPFTIEGRELMLTISIGVAIFPDNGKTASDLLRNADTAMYQAKALGRNTYSFFTSQMNTVIQRRLAIEEQMRGALQRKEFILYYQPQFDVKNNEITGAEALLRWLNPVLGSVAPDEFIPIAEKTGVIISIGEFVIKESLHLLKRWKNVEKLNKDFTIAVNLSPSQFKDLSLFNFIKTSLLNANIEPKNLELEITEGVLMTGESTITDTLTNITNLGVILSMDDFGTGYSSLSYLRQYPFNVLKIDRGFIGGITENNEDYSLVEATIAMSHGLGLRVVAEGVETQEQLTILKELGCDFAQGYYFSKPIPEQDLIDFSIRFYS
ncbi:EAL domain-containing protein [Pseudoalteromonas sp. CR1]|uniref:sensor domain-containing protein n=1 Tax=Pseudoalteromonas sp. CR1 TaxID=2861964 RepID=UPI001C5E4181|nr:bifunctional diguanylate cyclase/phosphodiesterase [Pseudoalteromonas sp. CR1]MBW4966041.1 EAL domain-containing protein [Pseudoalteromonas sp. CR1]